jgi:protein TonB
MTYFLAISIMLHAGIFLVTRHDEPVPPMPAGPVRITLLAELNTPPGTTADSAQAESSTRAHRPAGEPDSAPANTLPAHTDTTAAASTAMNTSNILTGKDSDAATVQHTRKPAMPTALTREDLVDRLQGQIRKALLPHFSYPLLARRRGWEGTVRIGLRVEANGSLTRLHLVEASRHDTLNRAAVKSLAQLARIPDASSWLDGQHLDLVLPIEYRLIDS